jgi:hypothetical protein
LFLNTFPFPTANAFRSTTGLSLGFAASSPCFPPRTQFEKLDTSEETLKLDELLVSGRGPCEDIMAIGFALVGGVALDFFCRLVKSGAGVACAA